MYLCVFYIISYELHKLEVYFVLSYFCVYRIGRFYHVLIGHFRVGKVNRGIMLCYIKYCCDS